MGEIRQVGRWYRSTDAAAQLMAGYTSNHQDALDAAQELARAGLLVMGGYYVPSPDELRFAYARISDAGLRKWVNLRWVMCPETLSALVKTYGGQRHPRPVDYAFNWPPELSLGEVEMVDVVSQAIGDSQMPALFGIRIRVDPAARHPMFEVDPD